MLLIISFYTIDLKWQFTTEFSLKKTLNLTWRLLNNWFARKQFSITQMLKSLEACIFAWCVWHGNCHLNQTDCCIYTQLIPASFRCLYIYLDVAEFILTQKLTESTESTVWSAPGYSFRSTFILGFYKWLTKSCSISDSAVCRRLPAVSSYLRCKWQCCPAESWSEAWRREVQYDLNWKRFPTILLPAWWVYSQTRIQSPLPWNRALRFSNILRPHC